MIGVLRFATRSALWIALILAGITNTLADGMPRFGRPSLVVPGGTFRIGDGVEGTVSLRQGDIRIPLSVAPNEKNVPDGKWLAEVPDGTTPGLYSLVRTTSTGETEHSGAVHVLESFPTNYVLALLRSDQVTSTEGTLFSSTLLTALREAAPDYVIVMGPLTPNGQEEAYEALDRQFATLGVPVFYCPDEQESAQGTYRKRYGNPVYPLQLGEDGYLFLGGGLSHVDSIHDALAGDLYRWRRALRASRWSVGVANRYGLDWSIREQLILFADDPLDFVLASEGVEVSGARVPWSDTRLQTFANGLTPALQLFDVSQEQFVQRVVKVAE